VVASCLGAAGTLANPEKPVTTSPAEKVSQPLSPRGRLAGIISAGADERRTIDP